MGHQRFSLRPHSGVPQKAQMKEAEPEDTQRNEKIPVPIHADEVKDVKMSDITSQTSRIDYSTTFDFREKTGHLVGRGQGRHRVVPPRCPTPVTVGCDLDPGPPPSLLPFTPVGVPKDLPGTPDRRLYPHLSLPSPGSLRKSRNQTPDPTPSQ